MKLLLTVARRQEVDVALAAGADLVDVKDPTRGSLGRPSPSLVAEVARSCADRCPVSVPLGDGPHRPPELRRAAAALLAHRPAYLKVGLHGGTDPSDAGVRTSAPDGRPLPGRNGARIRAGRWLDAVRAAVASAGTDARVVAVTFADAPAGRAPSPEELLPLARRHGADAVMLDTLGKEEASTVDLLGRRRLRRWVASAGDLGLETGLAGGLDETSMAGLDGVGVDVVGVRGGACAGGRRGRLDPGRCRTIRRAVDATSPRRAAAG